MKPILFLFYILLISSLITANGDFADGTGTKEDPFQISTPQQLSNLRNFLSTNYDISSLDSDTVKHFVLINDIDLGVSPYNIDEGWEPIGTYENPFVGHLDGNGYTIRNLYINSESSNVGLFGSTLFATIKNLRMENFSVEGNFEVGGLIGNASTYTVIDNVFAQGEARGRDAVGLIVGSSYGVEILNSTAEGSVYSLRSTFYDPFGMSNMGGIVGMLRGKVKNSFYDYTQVSINGENHQTGFVGAVSPEFFNSWISAGKTVNIDDYLSSENGRYIIETVDEFKKLSFLGQFDSVEYELRSNIDLSDYPNFNISYFSGILYGNGNIVSNLFIEDAVLQRGAGLFGYLSYAYIEKIGLENVYVNSSLFAGPLAGVAQGSNISQVYVQGEVIGQNSITSGFIGQAHYSQISNCYSDVSINSSLHMINGVAYTPGYPTVIENFYVIGNFNTTSNSAQVFTNHDVLPSHEYNSEIINSYWDMDLTGVESSTYGGEGKTSEEMKDESTFDGWDFETVWAIDSSVNNEYPYLRWQHDHLTSVKERKIDFEISLGPNPILNSVSVNISNAQNFIGKKVSLSLFNTSSRVLDKQVVAIEESNSNSVVFNLNHITPGLMFIVVEVEGFVPKKEFFVKANQ